MPDLIFGSALRPHVVTSFVLLSGSLLVLVSGFRHAREAVARALPAIVLCVAVGLAFLPVPAALQAAAAVAAAVAFIAHLLLDDRHAAGLSSRATRTTLLYLALALVIAGGFLFYELGDYAGSCLVWETGTVWGIGNAFRSGESAPHFAARQLVWSSGLLSTGDASLFYGAPTYALTKTFGFSTWNLRLAAAVCALLAVAVAFVFARRFFGNIAGAATALALACSVSFVYHGRYGVAMSATFLAVLLALLGVWLFLDRERHAWWLGGVAAAALYLATLQYATGRVVAVLLLAFAVVFSVLRRDRLRWRRLVGLAVLCLAAAAVWQAQGRLGARHALLEVRGEQFLVFSSNPYSYQVEFGRTPETVTWTDRLDLLRLTLDRTSPQLGALVTPSAAPLEPQTAVASNGREVRPYYAPLVAFLLLGIAHSLRRLASWPHACLLACTAGTSAALLLTSGVDAHRAAILTVPAAIWIGLGVREAAGVAARLRCPSEVSHALALTLTASCVFHLADQLYYTSIPQPEDGRAVLAEIESVEGPVVLAPVLESTEAAWVILRMLERQRRDPRRWAEVLDPRLLGPIRQTAAPAPSSVLAEVTALADRATLILAPAEEFQAAADALRQQGLTVTERGTEELRILRVERRGGGGSSDQ